MQTTKNFTSKHPQLYQLMSNLCQAGMGIEQVVEHGFNYALEYLCQIDTEQEPITASAWVLDVANELEISLKHQRRAMEMSSRY